MGRRSSFAIQSALVALAWARCRRDVIGYEVKDTFPSLSMGLLLSLAFFVVLYEHRVADLVALLGPWSWLALFPSWSRYSRSVATSLVHSGTHI